MDEKNKMTTDAPVQTAPEANPVAEAPVETAAVQEPAVETKPVENSVVSAQPAMTQPKKNKMALIIGALIAVVAIGAVVAYLMMGVSKTDYKEALTNVEDGEKSLTRQFEKAVLIMRTGPKRSTESDRKQLEELIKKNQQAMDEVAKLKAFSKDAELKKKIEELRDQQKGLDTYSAEVIETVYEVAPVLTKLGKINQQTGSEAQIDYARKTIDEIKKLEPKADFNKEFVKEIVEIFEEMFEKIDKAQAGGNLNMSKSNYVSKASQVTSKWTKAVRERTTKKNPTKDGFDSVKQYLKSKAE